MMRLRLRTYFFLLLVQVSVVNPFFAQEEPKYGMNGSWKIEDDRVKITYELFLPLNQVYEVKVVLKKEGDTTFSVVPRTIEGAVGRIYYTGGALEIVWDFKKDVQDELEGKYRFDFDVTEVVEPSMWKWWHYAAGGAALVAGTVMIIEAASTETVVNLPGPPRIRP